MSVQTITLGGGCFWCVEAVFERCEGITAVESGYCNGHVPNPSYEQVCGGDTGHVEVVRVSYDDAVIGLREVLEIFFHVHDPTTLNRQGNDVGTQYRSAIFTTNAQQTAEAQALLQEMQNEKAFDAPMVTQIEPLTNYWPAEDYHQDYFLQHPGQGYCAFVVGPKVQKFQKAFSRWLKD